MPDLALGVAPGQEMALPSQWEHAGEAGDPADVLTGPGIPHLERATVEPLEHQTFIHGGHRPASPWRLDVRDRDPAVDGDLTDRSDVSRVRRIHRHPHPVGDGGRHEYQRALDQHTR